MNTDTIRVVVSLTKVIGVVVNATVVEAVEFVNKVVVLLSESLVDCVVNR